MFYGRVIGEWGVIGGLIGSVIWVSLGVSLRCHWALRCHWCCDWGVIGVSLEV